MVFEALLTAILEVTISKTVKPARNAWAKWRRPKPAQNWVARLNNKFRDEVFVFNEVLKSEPKIILGGRYYLETDRKVAARQNMLDLQNEGKRNDPHAILVEQPRWGVDPIYLKAQTLYYSEVRALRDKSLGNLKPEILSANAVIFCNETREIILHERSVKSDTFNKSEEFKGRSLHTLGGAYQPPNMDGTDGDKLSLMLTAKREILEEAEASLMWEEDPPLVMMKELETGFIQLAILGINLSAKAARNLVDNWEGKILKVPFGDLPQLLAEDKTWVPTGKTHVLAWLALSAPNAPARVKFGKLTATELFNLIVK